MDLRKRLAELSLTLPPIPTAVGSYVPAKRAGNLIFVSGQIAAVDGRIETPGRVPSRVSLEQAQQAARRCVLNGLAAALSVGEPSGVVRAGVFVNADADFADHPKVANGASDLLLEIFGDAGRHARAAVGCSGLPLDTPVEVEFVFSE